MVSEINYNTLALENLANGTRGDCIVTVAQMAAHQQEIFWTCVTWLYTGVVLGAVIGVMIGWWRYGSSKSKPCK